MTATQIPAEKFIADRKVISQIQAILDNEQLTGNAYLDYAHELLTRHGFSYTDAPCSCMGNTEHGHTFFCGYTR